jgi:hypothetical protein
VKLILKHDDKKINYTNFPWIVLWSTQISRGKKFIEITIVAKDFDYWESELHPLPCCSPHTSYRFIIKFIIVVSFYINRFAKQTTNCKTLGGGTNIYRLKFLKMSTTSSWFNVRMKFSNWILNMLVWNATQSIQMEWILSWTKLQKITCPNYRSRRMIVIYGKSKKVLVWMISSLDLNLHCKPIYVWIVAS